MKTHSVKTLDSIFEQEHFVELYQDETVLYENLLRFVGGGLYNGDACVVIATSEHNQMLKNLLIKGGLNLSQAEKEGKFAMLDAAETLSKFMVEDLPDKDLFRCVIGGVLDKLTTGGKPARAFGEMVALLWEANNHPAAIYLEQLWNELAHDYNFTLYCAYPHHHFDGSDSQDALEHIGRLHSSLISPALPTKPIPSIATPRPSLA